MCYLHREIFTCLTELFRAANRTRRMCTCIRPSGQRVDGVIIGWGALDWRGSRQQYCGNVCVHSHVCMSVYARNKAVFP